MVLELCRRAEGNPYLPRIDSASELEGGGHLTALEFLSPVEAGEEAALQRWDDDADPDRLAAREWFVVVGRSSTLPEPRKRGSDS